MSKCNRAKGFGTLLSYVVLFLSVAALGVADPQRVYFTTIGTGELRSVRSNGAGLNSLTTFAGPPIAIGMDFDRETKLLYTTEFDSSSGAVNRYEANGANKATLIQTTLFPRDITVDTTHDFIFYTEVVAGGAELHRCDLNGQNCLTILSNGNSQYVEVDVDESASKVYFVEFGATTTIRAADLDGANVRTVVNIPSVESTVPIAVDTQNRKLYWALVTSQEVWSAELDGSNAAAILSGASVIALAVDGSTTPGTLYISEINSLRLATFQSGQAAPTTVVDLVTNGVLPTAMTLLAAEPLSPTVVIESPPAVVVANREVTLTFQLFDGADPTARAPANTKATEKSVRYDATITNIESGKKRRIITANAKISVSLGPGSYTASYNAQIVESRSKAAKKKIVDKAKSKLNALKGEKQTTSVVNKIQNLKAQIQLAPQKTVSQTNQSPESAPFVVQ